MISICVCLPSWLVCTAAVQHQGGCRVGDLHHPTRTRLSSESKILCGAQAIHDPIYDTYICCCTLYRVVVGAISNYFCTVTWGVVPADGSAEKPHGCVVVVVIISTKTLGCLRPLHRVLTEQRSLYAVLYCCTQRSIRNLLQGGAFRWIHLENTTRFVSVLALLSGC